jgi:hypothetical protein
MEKWRIFVYLSALALTVLSSLGWYWIIELGKTMGKDASIFKEIGLVLLFFVTAFTSVFALVLWFFPFFTQMETEGPRGNLNSLIFFAVLLSVPLLILYFNPKAFVNGYYSWVALILFGYFTVYFLIKYLKSK